MSLIHLLESRQLFAISLTPTPALPAPDPIFGEEFTAPFYLRADHVLRVNGSAGDDAIAFSRNAAGWVAELNGVSRMYAPADVTGFRAYGNTGNDSIEVSGGVWLATTLDGGDGHDTVSGGSGPDTIYGQGGNDTLRGNIGNDKLFGGYGMDTLTGQAGADEFRGGDDYDTVSYDDDVLRLGGVTVYFNGLTDEFDAEHDFLATDIECVRGSMGSDRFFGDARNNVFYGGPGNDRCFGGDGNDTFYGDNDDDTFFGGNGYDTAFGYLGNDTLHGEAGADRLDGGPGDDKLWGEGGADTLYGGEGDDCLWAGAGPDLDRLYGDNGFDTLVTLGGGADYAYGGDLDDRFWVDEAGVDVTDAGWWETDRGMVHRVSRFNNPVSFNASSEGVGSKELAGQNITNPRNTEDANGFHNYSNLPLFPAGGTSMDDVIQGKLGDCWIMAAISAMAKANGAAPIPPTDIIRNRMADMGDGTYAVKLGGSYYRVDADLPTRDGNPIYAGLGRSSSPSLWVPILEKAMVHHFADDYDDPVYYSEIEGGYAEDAFRALGMSDVTIDSGIDDGNELFNYLQDLLSSGHAVTLMTQPAIQGVSDKLVDLHVYTVDSVFVDADGHKRVRLRNPWGYDNNTGGYIDGPNDGYLTISAPTAYSSYWDIVSARVF